MTYEEAVAILGPEVTARIREQAEADPPMTELEARYIASLLGVGTPPAVRPLPIDDASTGAVA